MTSIEKKALSYLKYRKDNEYFTKILMDAEKWSYIVRFTVDEYIFSSFGEMFMFFAECYDDEVEAGNIKPITKEEKEKWIEESGSVGFCI